MTREEASRVSEALETAGISHTMSVHVRPTMATPLDIIVRPHGGPLTTTPEQIEAAQAVARAMGYRIALFGGEMEFVK